MLVCDSIVQGRHCGVRHSHGILTWPQHLSPIVWKHVWNGRHVALQHGTETYLLVVASVMLVIEEFREHGKRLR